MTRSAKESPEWRDFEIFVARIEKQLAPKGAIIKSPDRIYDKVTGRKREVDASIRYQVGSVPILITIECRKRDKIQDDTWVEQLATKRIKIGAQQTIAVSSKGFSDSAIKTAEQFSIELRQIKDITDEVIHEWMKKVNIQKIVVFDRVITWSIKTNSNKPIIELCETITNDIRTREKMANIIFRYIDDVGICVNELIEYYYHLLSEGKIEDESIKDLKDGGDIFKRRIEIRFNLGQFYTLTNLGKTDIFGVDIDLETQVKRDPVPLLKVYNYANLENEITQVAVCKCSPSSNLEKEYTIYIQPEKKL